MDSVDRDILQAVIDGAAEPIGLISTTQPDWPVLLENPAFEKLAGDSAIGTPFTDIIEALIGRDLALDVSEALRSGQETSFPIELGGLEYLLTLVPILHDDDSARYCAAYWRGGAAVSAVAGSEMHRAFLKAKRRVRDLSRDDPVTGLLNAKAFAEILEHDWAVARREGSSLAVIAFEIDDFDAYVEVFGRHAADTCLRRVGQAVRKFLRRASDVVARADSATFCVLAHSSDEPSVTEFASKIASAVRELGLHHPRSSIGRFVTIACRVRCVDGSREDVDAGEIFASVVAGAPGMHET